MDHFRSDPVFLKIFMYFEKYHIEFGTRMSTFVNEKIYGSKKQSFHVLYTARFAPEKCQDSIDVSYSSGYTRNSSLNLNLKNKAKRL